MRHSLITASLFTGLLLCGGSAVAARPNPAPPVSAILAKAPEAKGLFVETDDGAARHVASGMVCPLVIGKVNLWHLQVYAADGSDVGCDYGRNGPDNRWTAKLTIYAVRARADDTVDTVFARYKAELTGAYPNAQDVGAAITFGDEGTREALKDIRSEEYRSVVDGVHHTDDLVVAVRGDWVIEVRMTTTTDVASADEAALAASDLALPALAMFQVGQTLPPQP